LALTVNTLLIVAVGVLFPISPLGGILGFTPLPLPFFLFLIGSTLTYLILMEWAKRTFFAHATAPQPESKRVPA